MTDDTKADRSAAEREALQKDLEAGLRFVHFMGMQTKHDVRDGLTHLFALIEEMVARGQLDLRSFEERRLRLQKSEDERNQTRAVVAVAESSDKYQQKDLPVIDCAARIPLCKGRCCQLQFNLSFQDVEEGIVKWDYLRPYQIRKRADGYCTHSDPVTRGCQVYEQRPTPCRRYDCRSDSRIWLDFDKRIPAPEGAPDGGER